MKTFLRPFARLSLALAIILAYTAGVNAQSKADPSTAEYLHCHTAQEDSIFRANHPELQDEIRIAENELLENLSDGEFTGDRDTDYLISVVFHVIHDNGSENVSIAQIEDAIRVMNEDFSAANSGVNFVNQAFASLVADVSVGFALAQRDPNGNCTNGIVRTQNAITYEGGENLKQVSPVWDRSRYLNIWVCNTIASGAAGYTRYPSSVNGFNGAQIDGIVVRSDYVGAIGTSSVQRSHTLTHEVGHWINLPHLWGNSNDPGLDSNCGIDDGVADTPNTKGWTTCTVNGSSCGSLDNVENYMEYSFCSKMFTLGQAARMHAALNSGVAQRVNLWQPETLESTGVFLTPEVCSVDFTSNQRLICIQDSIEFTDLSSSAVTERLWTFEGGTPATSTDVNPSITYNTPGIYEVSLQVGDGQTLLSEVQTNYIRVLDASFSGLPFTESFEETGGFNVDPNDAWFTNNEEGSIDWETTSQASFSGNRSAYVRGYANSSGNTEQLISQTFNLDGITENPVLSFRYASARRNSQSNDRLRVYISRDCGNSWSLRKTLTGDDLNTVSETFPQEFFPQSADQWQQEFITSIVPIFHTSFFRVRFDFTSEAGNNFFLDDINLSDPAVLSINDANDQRGKLVTYPNPAADVLYISMEGVGNGSTELRLFDLSGRLIFADNWNQSQSTGVREISTAELVNGLYVLQISSNGALFSGKVVVNR